MSDADHLCHGRFLLPSLRAGRFPVVALLLVSIGVVRLEAQYSGTTVEIAVGFSHLYHTNARSIGLGLTVPFAHTGIIEHRLTIEGQNLTSDLASVVPPDLDRRRMLSIGVGYRLGVNPVSILGAFFEGAASLATAKNENNPFLVDGGPPSGPPNPEDYPAKRGYGSVLRGGIGMQLRLAAKASLALEGTLEYHNVYPEASLRTARGLVVRLSLGLP